jgi:outer membrane protein TolC
MTREAHAMSRSTGLLPDPMLSMTATGLPWNNPVLGASMMSGVEVSIMQPLWWPAELEAQREAQHARADAAHERADEARVALIIQATELYYQIHAIDRASEALERSRAPLEAMRDLLIARAATGAATLPSVERIKLALLNVEDEQLTLLHERPGKVAALNGLLQRPADAPIHPTVDPRLDGNVEELDVLVERAMSRRPAVAAQRAAIRAAQAEREAARYVSWPRVTWMAGWMFRTAGAPMGAHEVDDGVDMIMFGFQSTLPIRAATRADAAVDAATARVIAAQAELEAFEQGLRAQLGGRLGELRHLAQHVVFYQDKLLPQARAARDITLSGIDAAERGLDPWLEAELAVRRAQLKLARLDAQLRREHAIILAITDELLLVDERRRR